VFDLPEPPSTPVQRLHMALSLYDDGVAIMRSNLRRRNPAADEAELHRLLVKWLHDRPGAELGDGEGRPRLWTPEA